MAMVPLTLSARACVWVRRGGRAFLSPRGAVSIRATPRRSGVAVVAAAGSRGTARPGGKERRAAKGGSGSTPRRPPPLNLRDTARNLLLLLGSGACGQGTHTTRTAARTRAHGARTPGTHALVATTDAGAPPSPSLPQSLAPGAAAGGGGGQQRARGNECRCWCAACAWRGAEAAHAARLKRAFTLTVALVATPLAGVLLAFATVGTALSAGRVLERGTITIKGAFPLPFSPFSPGKAGRATAASPKSARDCC
jgi:hypothetical protein